MKQIVDPKRMSEITPDGTVLKYLIAEGRVFASAASWARALQVPSTLRSWFEENLHMRATLKSEHLSGDLEAQFLGTAVYRWPPVAETLRHFDRNWYNHQYKKKPLEEQRALEKFHKNYDKLVAWGYDLQEKALSSLVNPVTTSDTPVTQGDLVEAIKEAVAPRFREHDGKLNEHDMVITEIRNIVPVFRDSEEFITIKQAITEQGLDATKMPLYPQSKETLSGLAGQELKKRGFPLGPTVVSRIDGRSISTPMNTYKRKDIYQVLDEICSHQQGSLF